MSSSQASPGPPATPPAGGGGPGDAAPGSRSSSMIQTAPGGRSRRRHMKRTRSAPDCKHGAKKIKVGVCAMDKKAQSKPMCEILARLTAGGEFEVVLFGDKVILNEPVEAWPLCDVLLSWHSEGFPLRKAQLYVELRHPFLINDVHSQDLLLDRRRVYKTLMDHNIPIPRHILVNREPAPAPEPSVEPPADIDELTTSSSSAGSSPRAGGTKSSSSSSKAATQAFKPAAPATDGAAAAAAQPGDAAPAADAAASGEAGDCGAEAAAAGEVVLLDPPGFVEEEDYVELDGVRIDKPFVEKPVSGEDHNIHIYYPHSMGGGVKRLFRKVDNKSADYDPHHPGTVRRDGSFIYEEFLTTGGTDVKVYTVGPRYAHAEARKSPVVDGKVNRTPDGKEVRFPVLLSPQEKEIARMVCLAFGQRVCGFDLLRSETGRSYVCDVNGWSFVKNSKKYYDDAAGILRVMILSQLAPQRLTIAPEAPMPLSGLLEEVAAAASDGQSLRPQSVTDGSEDGSGLKMREPSILAAAQPAELGWEEHPSVLADLDAEGNMKEVGSLQDLTSLDGTYEEEGMGTDDSSSTAGVAASELSRNLELRCVLAVIRHGDRTPKQKMKVTVTQAPLIALYNKYKDSKGKQAKLKSPGQLQELLDVVRALLADMETKSSSQRSSRSSTPAPGGQLTEEEKAQEQHEELREKLRIVRTVLEQGGTFAGINRKVQLKPTKWSTPSSNSSSSKPPTPAPDAAEQQQGAVAGEQLSQQSPAQQQQQPSQGSKAQQPGEGGARSARTSSTGGGPPAAAAAVAADGKPQVTELLLILKYGGVLTHSGRAQSEDLGKTFRMVMYPRYGPAGGGGFLRLHSTYRHDLKIYSSDEGRVQMSAAAFIKGLLDLEGSSLTPILVSLVTKNASMLDAFGKGASDDILNAKNMLYQHLTWDPEKTVSLCSKLALPLATPAIGVTPPVSPKSAAAADESHSPFFSGAAAQRGAHAALDNPTGSGGLPASATNSGVSTPTAAGHHSTSFGQDGSLPTTGSCMDLLQQGKSGSSAYAALRRGTRASGTGSGTGEQQQQQQGAGALKGSGGAGGGLIAAATANAAGLHVARGLSKLTHSGSWSAVRAAEARAAALSGIKAMPDQPLALLFQLVELMKVVVDQLREKCLEERVEATTNPHSRSSLDRQEAAAAAAAGASDKAGADKAAAAAGGGADRAAGGGGSLQPSNSARGISSSRYSSLASSPDDWRLDETKPCSGERLLLMFDRWRKLLKSFYNEKKQQFDISKVPDIYDSAKYDAIHNSHLQLSSLADLYRISRQLAAVVVPHEYGLDEQGKLLIGSKICSELLGKLMCDLESMKEESIVTAEIEAQTAAARTEAAAAAANSSSSSSRPGHPSRQRVTSHASLLEGSNFDAFESEFGHMSVLDGRMRPPKPPSAPGSRHSLSSSSTTGQAGNWAGAAGAAGGQQHSRASQQGTAAAGSDGQQQQQQQGDGGGGGGGEEQAEDMGEQETLHRLCPTYASDVNSPLRHVRTRIYFTSESHIHSLVNVLRYCHLLCPGSGGSCGLTSYGTAAPGSISKASSTSNFPVAVAGAAASTTAAAAAVPAGSGSSVAAAAAATAVQPAADAASVDAVAAAVAAVSLTDAATPAVAAAVSRKPKGTVFASPAAAAAAAASGAAGAAADGGDPALVAASSVTSSVGGQQQQPQQLLTPEGQALLAGTDEFDYLTHIVFRMYENKMAAVDAPERFFVEIQFSNGANYDPTVVEPPRHTMPTQPRRLLTNVPGVPLQTFQELTGKFARGKMAPCNYQLQYALRAPLSTMNTLSKAPTPGMSRAGSANLGPAAPTAPTPPLPPVPRPPSPVPTAIASAAALLAGGPGAAPSAPLPSSVAAAAAAAVTADHKGS